MNEDYSDNDSMNTNSNDPISISPELQVRLMNLVLGEASDFERDQLQLLMEQRAEVAAYYQHLEHLHGLLSEVGAGDPLIDGSAATEDGAWQLSADRRAKVLAVIDNPSSTNPSSSQADKVTLASKTMPKALAHLHGLFFCDCVDCLCGGCLDVARS